MKRKMTALMLSAMMTVSLMTGCESSKAVAAETESITETKSVMEPETTHQLTEEECLAIDGGDAEYWKWYDAEGNPVSRDETEPESETTETNKNPADMSDDELTEWLDGGDADDPNDVGSDLMSDALYNLDFYRDMGINLGTVEIYDSADLTLSTLITRNGKTIVEKCYGIVLDEDGNGRQLNPSVEGQDYIKYHNLPVGSVVLSVFVYNPDTNAEDDIISRSDWVLDTLD